MADEKDTIAKPAAESAAAPLSATAPEAEASQASLSPPGSRPSTAGSTNTALAPQLTASQPAQQPLSLPLPAFLQQLSRNQQPSGALAAAAALAAHATLHANLQPASIPHSSIPEHSVAQYSSAQLSNAASVLNSPQPSVSTTDFTRFFPQRFPIPSSPQSAPHSNPQLNSSPSPTSIITALPNAPAKPSVAASNTTASHPLPVNLALRPFTPPSNTTPGSPHNPNQPSPSAGPQPSPSSPPNFINPAVVPFAPSPITGSRQYPPQTHTPAATRRMTPNLQLPQTLLGGNSQLLQHPQGVILANQVPTPLGNTFSQVEAADEDSNLAPSFLPGTTRTGKRRRRHPVAEVKGNWTYEEDSLLIE